MASHPDLAAEQAYIDHAYACLESSRQAADPPDLDGRGRPGRHRAGPLRARGHLRARVVNRLTQLQLGDAALCFGRIDRAPRRPARTRETFYIGRIAVSDDEQEPVIVDWRAPVAEPFYRATGRQPMGLARRRHFATRGRQLLAIEDELFGDTLGGLGVDRRRRASREVTGQGALFTALETARTGRLGDIVATIQGEQDEIIRAPLPGVLVVQGGPGTGKTVVALHRAAYLLYTHRFPLEGQGVLVIGPNRLFLGYIEQVLPVARRGRRRAGRARRPRARRQRRAPTTAASPPGSRATPAWSRFLARAVRDRERAPAHDLVVGYGLQRLTLTRERSAAHRRRRPPPLPRATTPARRYVEGEVFAELALVRPRRARRPPRCASASAATRRSARRSSGCGRCSPRPSCCTTSSAARPCCATPAATSSTTASGCRCYRSRVRLARRGRLDPRRRARCSTRPGRCSAPSPKRRRPGEAQLDDEIRTYGHIVVDEAQDLSPDAAADARAPLAQRLDDRRRRHRPGHRRSGPTSRGTRSSTCLPAEAPGPPHRAHPRLPPARPDHGAGRPGAAPRRPRHRAAAVGARGRRRARASAGPRRARWRAEVVAAALDERAAVDPGQVAVIVPAVARRRGLRRPRRRRRSASAGPPATASSTGSPSSRSAWSRASRSTPPSWSSPPSSSTRRPRATGPSTWPSPAPPSAWPSCTSTTCRPPSSRSPLHPKLAHVVRRAVSGEPPFGDGQVVGASKRTRPAWR